MRPRSARARRIVIVLLGAAIPACSSDLFHRTDWPTRCDATPDAAGCPTTSTTSGAGGAGGDASTTTSATTTTAATTTTTGASGGGGAGAGGAQADAGM